MSEALVTTRVVAILRAENASRAEDVVHVLLENGIRSLELTLTTKGALEVVERLAAKVPDGTDLGVGTVLTADEVDRAVDAGARFVVSPSVVPEVIEAATAARHRELSRRVHPYRDPHCLERGRECGQAVPRRGARAGIPQGRARSAAGRPAGPDRRCRHRGGRRLAGRGSGRASAWAAR